MGSNPQGIPPRTDKLLGMTTLDVTLNHMLIPRTAVPPRTLLLLSCLLTLFSALSCFAADPLAPKITGIQPSPGMVHDLLKQVTVTFSSPVTGIDIDDLLVNNLPVVAVSGADDTYTFTLLQPQYGPVQISWQTDHSIQDLGNPPHLFDASELGATWSYSLVDTHPPSVTDLFPKSGVTVSSFSELQVQFSESVSGVEADDLLLNGSPALGLESFPNGRYVFHFNSPSAGTVQLAWKEGHGITDLAHPETHAFGGGTWSLTLDPNAARAKLVINEILAANENGLTDEDSTAADPQPQDWIEIYNRSPQTVNLAGWSLTDDPDQPGRWVFPNGTLKAGGYLVVFASGKDRKNPTGTNRFHTNFKLSPRGEFLGLYTPDSPRVLADALSTYPVQRNDISYGRDSVGDGRYYTQPTPGATNTGPTVIGACDEVQFSAPRGHYNSAFSLHISSPTPGAFIRYTLDGSEPTLANGLIYTNSLRLTNTAVVRAVAFREDRLSSLVGTATYLFKQNAAVRSLPILSIVTAAKNLTGPTGIAGIGANYQNPDQHGIAWERPTSVEFIRSEDNSGFQVDCGLRIQGSDYTRPRYTPDSKFSYRLYFRGDYGSGRLQFPFFEDSPLQEYDQIVLRAGHNDETNPFLRDEMVRQIASDSGQVACHGNFVNLFINGVYKGYYNPTERVEEQFLQAYHGGGDQWDVITVDSAVQGGDAVAWNELRTLVARTNVSLATGYGEVAKRLDLTNFVDYLFVNIYASTWDWPHNNWRAARERTPKGLFRFYVWDAEGGFLSSRGTSFDPITSSDSGLGTVGSEIPDMFNKLRTSPEFRMLFADRVHKHFYNNGALVESNLTSRFVDMRAPLLQAISGFDNGILSEWIPQRRKFLTSQLLAQKLIASTNAPTLNQFGGRVHQGFQLSLKTAAINGVIYYSLNGSDPRIKFSNAVAADALLYSNPIVLTKPILLQARTLQGTTNWSALTTTTFDIESLGSPLRITEIHYNPEGGAPYEFVELLNTSDAPMDVSGVSFEGIDFAFVENTWMPGGARWVISSNSDTNAFRLSYPGVPVVGSFNGSLNNNGERLSLLSRSGQVIVSVDYKDNQGWPVAADGLGFSLELIDTGGDPDSPANWSASATRHGTPGKERIPGLAPAVRLNEVMADNAFAVDHAGTRPDWVEFYNPNPTSVSLSGWSLSDDGNARKFVFPAGTQIAANGYLLLWCDSADTPTPGLHSGFALGRNGESIFLYDASTNRVDALTFGLQITDRTLGLIENRWVLTEPTPGAQNMATVLAGASQLTLNEWLVPTLPGLPGWVELRNRSTHDPVSLEGLYLSNSNEVYRLAQASYLPPGGYLQLMADGGVGPGHVDFALTPKSGAIALYDASGVEVDRIRYTGQTNRISQGRFPEDSTNLVRFPNSPSPGAPNYLPLYAGPIINEVLARNVSLTNGTGQITDWFELFNTNAVPFDLGGMSVSLDEIQAGQWYFPTGTTIAAKGFLVIECDSKRPATLNVQTAMNTGQALNGEGGGVYLFNSAGQLVSSFVYGAQLQDRSIGVTANQRRLLSSPTPGQENSPAATVGQPIASRINEWMSHPWTGDDWFEIYNTTNQAIDLGGLSLSDDPSAAGTNRFRIPPLTLIDTNGWLLWIADGEEPAAPGHVNFKLSAEGGSLRLYATNGNLIDGIDFPYQLAGVSSGRLPDGAAAVTAFPQSRTPGESNYRELGSVVINEVMTEAQPAFERAIELANLGSSSIDISRWYLSDDRHQPQKHQIPDGILLPPGGFHVVYETSWKSDASPLNLRGSQAGELWLFESDAQGRLTGAATRASYGPAPVNLSQGSFDSGEGTESLLLERPTFGVSNPASVESFRSGTGQINGSFRAGPVVISEIMYEPSATGASDVEYLELENSSSLTVDLAPDGFPQRAWQLRDAVEFSFPAGTQLAPGARLLVVGFSPQDQPTRLAGFRNAYGIHPSIQILGPFVGQLDNKGDDLYLVEPLPPDPTTGVFASYKVDRVHYDTRLPWPGGKVTGGGLSLQRRDPSSPGNSPFNWFAASPTPGSPTAGPIQALPTISVQPVSKNGTLAESASLSVLGSGPGPLWYQWRLNGNPLSQRTNATLVLDPLLLESEGLYDVVVANAGGTVISRAARFEVLVPLVIVDPPRSQLVRGNANSNAVFNVLAWGNPPLSYQWHFNDTPIEGATSGRLTVSGVTEKDEGRYTVAVSDGSSTRRATAILTVAFSPLITLQPQPQSLLVGDTLTLKVLASGTTPMTFRWRRGLTVVSNIFGSDGTSLLVLTNARTTHSGAYSVLISNVASSLNVTSVSVNVGVFVDTDKDRLPDVWETANGFSITVANDPKSDTDGDGVLDSNEYLSGTNPRDATSFLKLERITAHPDSVRVSFSALSNRTYSILFRDDLDSLSWNRLTNILSRTTNRFETVVDTEATNASRIYRLVTPLDP